MRRPDTLQKYISQKIHFVKKHLGKKLSEDISRPVVYGRSVTIQRSRQSKYESITDNLTDKLANSPGGRR